MPLLVAQLAGATLAGTVRDGQSGEPLAGVVVTLPDLSRSALTDARGRYDLRDVPAGPQHVRVERIGYRARTLHALVPPSGVLTIDVALGAEPVPLAGITARGPPVTADAMVGDVPLPERGLTAAALRNDALLGEPDALEALSGGVIVVAPEMPTGVHIRGGAADHTAFTLDGIPILNPVHAAGVFGAWNPDALLTVRTDSDAPSATLPLSLSGTVAAETRPPGAALHAMAALSTTQARITADGPIGDAGAGWLLALRSGLPGIFAPRDASHLRGEFGDALLKLEAPLIGGAARVLAYDSRDEIGAAARAGEIDPAAPRHAFEWGSRSFGAEWLRSGVRVRLWHARADADATWAGAAPERLSWRRRDTGLLIEVERGVARAGARLERSRTDYGVTGEASPGLRIEASTPSAAAFLGSRARLGGLLLDGEAVLVFNGGETRFGPRVRLGWVRTGRLSIVASLARTHQLAQSLRNAESVVGTVYPADLHVGAGADGVPVAKSDQAVLAAGLRIADGLRVTAQVYTRKLRDLLLVAPSDGGPFPDGEVSTGRASARGLAVEAVASGAHWSASATWLWQRVRFAAGDSAYVPAHGARHLLEAGVVVFPTATASARLGIAAGFGRRGTTIPGGFEWEACNLLDQGCEFAGSPDYSGQPLGAATLPSYVRVDLGLRKHWHVRVGGRDALLGVFGTATNLLGRRNVLTYAIETATGAREIITMRPFSPLVAGVEARF